MSGISTPTVPARAPRWAWVGVPALALALAACGGSGSSAPSSPTLPAAGAGQAAPSGGGAGGGGRQPGVSGRTAEISGDTLQVQGSDGQTAVRYSASTRIAEQRDATAAAVTVGSCVMAIGRPDGAGLAAETVAVSRAAAGSCTGADAAGPGGGFRGQRGGSASGSAPRSAPDSGGPGANGPGGNGPGGNGSRVPAATAFGTVTAVTPTSITLSGRLRSFTRGVQGSPSATGASPTPEPVTVTVAAATRYTATAAVTSKSLAVGQCVTALGTTDDIGTVTARSITIRPAGPQGCSTGFGGRRAPASGSASGASGA